MRARTPNGLLAKRKPRHSSALNSPQTSNIGKSMLDKGIETGLQLGDDDIILTPRGVRGSVGLQPTPKLQGPRPILSLNSQFNKLENSIKRPKRKIRLKKAQGLMISTLKLPKRPKPSKSKSRGATPLPYRRVSFDVEATKVFDMNEILRFAHANLRLK